MTKRLDAGFCDPPNEVETSKEALSALSSEEIGSAFELLFEAHPQPMWIFDRDSFRFLAVNKAATARYGYSREEFLSKTIADIRPAEDVPKLRHKARKYDRWGNNEAGIWRHLTKAGDTLHVCIHTRRFDWNGIDSVIVVASDVTDLFQTTKQVREQEVFIQEIFENSPEGIIHLDADWTIVGANSSFQQMFGFELGEVLGKSTIDLIVPDHLKHESENAMQVNMENRRPNTMQTTRCRRDGTSIDVEITSYPIYVDGERLGIIGLYKDIGKQKRSMEAIELLSRTDSLTGLSNRRGLAEEVEEFIASGKPSEIPGSFIYLDLDQFKVINDTCGHLAGDKALKEIACILRSAVCDDDVVARLGGDEFGILLKDCDIATACTFSKEILNRLNQYRFVVERNTFPLSGSIGVFEINANTVSIEEILRAADAACFMAKEKGRNRIQAYCESDAEFMQQRAEMNWVSILSEALEKDRFVLYFQKIRPLSAEAENINNLEVLIRYQDDDGKLIPPGAFIPAAERYNLMPKIDRWVLREVCTRLSKEAEKVATRKVGINISGTTLSDEEFSDYAKMVIEESGIAPSWLCFEITETAVISNFMQAKKFIKEMRRIGCSIALDDFGSGMSSFSYLRDIPADYMKIDGAFIRNIHTCKVNRAMTEAINKVGKVLGLKTVAEFVESDEIAAVLQEIGVDFAQGYGIHKPEVWNQMQDVSCKSCR